MEEKLQKIVKQIAYSAGDSIGEGYREYTEELLALFSSHLSQLRERGRLIVDIPQGNDGSEYSKGWYDAMDYVSNRLDELVGGKND